MGKKHVEGRDLEERRAQRRQAGTLRDLLIQPRTRARYGKAVNHFFMWLQSERRELPDTAEGVDQAAADYLEFCWEEGLSRGPAADALGGLRHFVPTPRKELKESWRLLRAWDEHEVPARAPPMLASQALAMA